MKLRILFTIIILIISVCLYSQNTNLSRKIEWKSNRNIIRLDSKTVLSPFFKGANYDFRAIPFYSEIISLKDYNLNFSLVNMDIKNIVYEKLGNINNSIFKNSSIGDEFSFKYKINKGRNDYLLEFSFYPFINKNGNIYKIKSFEIEISKSINRKKQQKKNAYATNSVLNSGKWYKIAIPKTGVYKLTTAQLSEMGFDNIANVRVFGNDNGTLPYYNNVSVSDDLIENYIYKGSGYILFYAKSAQKWKYNTSEDFFYRQTNIYTDTAYYFITDKSTGFSNSIPNATEPSGVSTATITSYTFYETIENQEVNLISSGRQWLGYSFLYNQEQDFSFDISNAKIGADAKLKVALAVRSPLTSSFSISYAGNTNTKNFGSYYGAIYQQYVDYQSTIYTFSQNSSTLNINLTFNKPTSSADAWLDYLTINATANLKFEEQLTFRSTENVGLGSISRFELSNGNTNVQIWNVTSPTRPQNINYSSSGNTLYFKVKTDTINEFISFTSTNCLSPVITGKGLGNVSNQNLHNVSSATDMIIICHPDFLSQALAVEQIHESYDNFNTVVATTDQIYNEFSSGGKDISALRNYIKMVYDKTGANLRYVFLFGDGSYNNFGETSELNPNFIPTYQSLNSFNISGLSTTSDDYFGLLDFDEGELNGYLDVAVGRFPAKNSYEADIMVDKLQKYYSSESFGDWKNIITLVADDKDKSSDNFTLDAEVLADKIDTAVKFINIKKIYLDAFQQQSSANGQEYPDAVTELNNRINTGSLIVNYLGHGSEVALTSERLVTVHEIQNWNNENRLPLFITGTCEFSRFDDAKSDIDATSAGEMVILNPNGGAIAMLTTARVSFSGTNLYMNEAFYSYLFSKQAGKYLTIGDAYFMAKNTMSSSNKLFFVLLGDPAIRLNYPKNKIVLSKINEQDITVFSDTLKALQKVKIEGVVNDESDNLFSSFNGEINLTFYDKKKNFNTLDNDGNGAVSFWSQYNQLFSGRANVNNGIFSLEFIIPKDIYFNYEKSKFSFYAFDNSQEATGYNKDVVLGGINNDAVEDLTGPTINLFMNDSSFVDGGITDANPSIYAVLFDENGINVSSASIGHNITAILDNDTKQTFSLNEYYKSKLNTYKQGIVNFGLYKLEPGEHTVKLKVWDVFNNSSEKSINFIVAESKDLEIKHLLNYPNPFTTHTSFYFEHNKPGIEFDILLQIFTVSGKVVKTIHTTMNTVGFRSNPIDWNGLDDFGKPIGRGVYIYSLKIRTPDGKIVQIFEKLLILK